MPQEHALINMIFKQVSNKLVVFAMRKRKEVDEDIIDASDIYCFYINIEKYVDLRIRESPEKFNRTALKNFASFISSEIEIQRKFSTESHMNYILPND